MGRAHRTVTHVLLLLALLMACAGCGLTGYGGRSIASQSHKYHRVQPGETLASISRKYHIPADTIALLNSIRDPSKLQAGQVLYIGYGMYDNESGSGATVQRASWKMPMRQGDLWWPIDAGEIVSTFGPRWGTFHDGLDIAAGTGTPVYAAHDGIVAYSSDDLSGYGKVVILQGRSSLVTVYAHNSRLLVSFGDHVKKGDKIALVGATGHASGPHLHFEVRMKDQRGRYVAVDPLPLFSQGAEPKPRYRVNESLTPILARLFK